MDVRFFATPLASRYSKGEEQFDTCDRFSMRERLFRL